MRNRHLAVLALGMAGVVSLQTPAWVAWGLFGLVAACILSGQAIERWLPLERAPLGFALHAFGDALYLCALAVWIGMRRYSPSPAGAAFTLLVLALAAGAAVVNLNLQLGRLRDVRHGRRFSLADVARRGIVLRTPRGDRTIAWAQLELIERVDARQAVVLLRDPLPASLLDADIPWEAASPHGQALILHEQELGREVGSFLELVEQSRGSTPAPDPL